MTLVETLRALRDPDRALREEAAHRLSLNLREYAQGKLFEPASRMTCSIPGQDREDVVQRVLIKILDLGEIPAEPHGEAACARYLHTMLARMWLSTLRLQRRERPVVDSVLESAIEAGSSSEEEPADREGAHAVADARAALAQLFAEALQARVARFRPALERSWQQVNELAFESVTMLEILRRDEGVEPEADEQELERARARLHTAHKRLRQELAAALDRIRERGAASPEWLDLARRSLQVLLRCQSRPSAASSESE